MKNLLLIVALLLPMSALAQQEVSISLAHGTSAELKIKNDLLLLLKTYPLDDFIFMEKVVIDEQAPTPRSYPVVTMNTDHEYLNDPLMLLSTFIHEQLHWYLIENGNSSKEAFRASVKEEFPHLKVAEPLGDGDEGSTLSHLVVCFLEYQALTSLLGRDAARAQIAKMDWYTWIYEQALDERNREKFVRILGKNQLPWPIRG